MSYETIIVKNFDEFHAKTMKLISSGYSCTKDYMTECWLKSPEGEFIIIKQEVKK